MIVALPCYSLENAAAVEARFNRLEAVKYSAEEPKSPQPQPRATKPLPRGFNHSASLLRVV
jgi:hypothetical protein